MSKIHIDIRDDISPDLALECVKQVVKMGRISDGGKVYCYATTMETSEGDILVWTNQYRKSDCFRVEKEKR